MVNSSNGSSAINWTNDSFIYGTDTILRVTLLIPSYLVFTVCNGFLLSRSRDLSRHFRHYSITLVRLISFLLVLVSSLIIYMKYFYSKTVVVDSNDPAQLASSIICDIYQLVAFSLHFLVVFNKAVFAPYPLGLLTSLCFVSFANIFYSAHEWQSNWYDLLELNSFDQFQLVILFVNDFLLMAYFVVLITASFKSLLHDMTYQQLMSDHESEEDQANYLSYLTFEWLQPIMVKGYQQKIEVIDHLSQLPLDLNVSKVSGYFMQKYLNNQQQNNPIINPELLLNQETYQDLLADHTTTRRTRTLGSALMRSFGHEFMVLGFFKLLNDIINFAGPLLLNQLVQFVQNKEAKLKDGCMFAAALFLATLIGSVVNIHFTNSMNKLCLRIKTALITLIYSKAVIVRTDQLNKFSTGQIVNYMSIDTDAVVNAFPSIHSFWSLPFQIAVTLILLYWQIGLSCLVGVGFVIVLVPINKVISDYIGKVQQKLMVQKDSRVKLMTEFLNGIKVIKFYAWEKYFLNRINVVREKELKQLKAKRYLDAGFVYFWATTPLLMSVLTFTTYVLLGNRLTPTKVFTSLALFNMLINPLNSFPTVINGLVKAKVSFKRLKEFLGLENLDWLGYYSFFQPRLNLNAQQESNHEAVLMNVNNADFKWKQQNSSVLHELNLEVRKGQLIGIIGKVGCGKSSLLHAIMAEITKTFGTIEIDAECCSKGFAYVGQDGWIKAGTIRENILFGARFNPELYFKVIEACALIPDIESLPYGDETYVGDNGVTLSGGQKTRLALARACYASDKQIYLFDGPFTSIDPNVAKKIYELCICDLLKDKTRILCTHHAEYLMNADLVLVVDNGKVIESGTGEQLIPRFAPLKRAYKCSSQNLCNLKSFRQDSCVNFSELVSPIELDENSCFLGHHSNHSKDTHHVPKVDLYHEGEHGLIDLKVYKYYCFSIGMFLSVMTLVTLTLTQASRNITDFWLSYWTEHHSFSNLSIHPVELYYFKRINHSKMDETSFFLNVYGGLCALNSLFTLFKTFFFAYNGIVAGRFIHQCLIDNLSKANLKFFHNTPTGKILNRLSSDIYAINGSLPVTLNIFLARVFSLIGVFVVTCYSLPVFSLSLFPMLIIYYKIQSYYRWTSRELKRITSISLTPVYTHFHETLGGITTIRAFRQIDRFIKKNESYLNDYVRAAYVGMAASQWLNFRLQMISVVMITAVGFTAVFQHIYWTVDASLVGLALSYILSVTGLLNGLITSFTETEKEMVSVERAHQFEKIETENWLGTEETPNGWPQQPSIEFIDVTMQYNKDDDNALNEMSFQIRPGEKVGICGRTGSGKSSIFMAIFRGEEVKSGTIKIDGVNIRNISISSLRESMSIIPQDPFLFDGTLRENLDLSNKCSDSELWNALRKCRLDIKFRIEPAGLDFKIGEKGKNLSSGEKQLVCLARAILTNRKILCIDEATASVDFDTDNFIQQTIRKEFKHATILKIAHRMNTIINYDKVLVIDNGNVVEFDTPQQLLANPSSVFYNLVSLDK